LSNIELQSLSGLLMLINSPERWLESHKVTLSPLNQKFKAIELTAKAEDDVNVLAEFIAVLGRS